MGYRKMYQEILLYFLILLPFEFVFENFFTSSIIGKAFIWVTWIVLGLYGNVIYFNFAKRIIKKSKGKRKTAAIRAAD